MTWHWLDNFLWFVVAMIAIVQVSAISQQLAKIREDLRALAPEDEGESGYFDKEGNFVRVDPPDPD